MKRKIMCVGICGAIILLIVQICPERTDTKPAISFEMQLDDQDRYVTVQIDGKEVDHMVYCYDGLKPEQTTQRDQIDAFVKVVNGILLEERNMSALEYERQEDDSQSTGSSTVFGIDLFDENNTSIFSIGIDESSGSIDIQQNAIDRVYAHMDEKYYKLISESPELIQAMKDWEDLYWMQGE